MKSLMTHFKISSLVTTLALATVAFLASPSDAASRAPASTGGRDVGLGIVLGAPTGLTGKFFLNNQRAIDLGLSFSAGNYILIYGDYLAHFPGAFGRQNDFIAQLTPYGGVGPLAVFATKDMYHGDYFDNHNSTFALGVRIPLGIEWRGTTVPLGVALEIAPGLTVAPGTYAFVQAGVALRFYF